MGREVNNHQQSISAYYRLLVLITADKSYIITNDNAIRKFLNLLK